MSILYTRDYIVFNVKKFGFVKFKKVFNSILFIPFSYGWMSVGTNDGAVPADDLFVCWLLPAGVIRSCDVRSPLRRLPREAEEQAGHPDGD